LQRLKAECERRAWRILPYRLLVNARLLIDRLIGPDEAWVAANAQLACTQKNILRRPPSHSHFLLWRKKAYLEKALHARNPTLIQEMTACGAELNRHLLALGEASGAIILAPMHMVSDIVAGSICSFVSRPIFAISTHRQGSVGASEATFLADHRITLLDPGSNSGAKLKSAILATKRLQSFLVVYPDVPPEVSLHLTKKPMRTFSCEIFGKPALLHSGISELANLANAQVVFFCLTEIEGKLAVEITATLPANRLLAQMPAVIEAAIARYPQNWLLWHFSSLFYFNVPVLGHPDSQ
jgi:hypothetical protein